MAGETFSGVVSTTVASAERMVGDGSSVDRIAEAELIDPGLGSQRMIEFFRETTNLSELIEGYEPTVLENEDLRALSYIVGKDYERCETFELDAFEPPNVVPYFRVRAGGVEYGSESMGLGEMALHLTFWHLKSAPAGSVLIVEEPEAHISPRSQTALLDVMAWLSVERKLWIVLTTHSPGILTRVPSEHIRLVFRAGSEVRIIDKPTDEQLSGTLGVVPRRNVIALVEDTAAKAFVEALVANSPEGLESRVDVRACRDAGTLRAILERFPAGKSDDGAKIVGLLDGDQRHEPAAKTSWPVGYLPGESGVERILRSQFIDPTRVSRQLGIDENRFVVALSEVAGRDDHDWLIDLAHRCGASIEHMVKALVREWILGDGADASAEVLAILMASASPESGATHCW
ncbi:MAG: AAA family ATPase [Vicinamibacterales bacterium]